MAAVTTFLDDDEAFALAKRDALWLLSAGFEVVVAVNPARCEAPEGLAAALDSESYRELISREQKVPT